MLCHSPDLSCAALCHVILSELHSDFSHAEIHSLEIQRGGDRVTI